MVRFPDSIVAGETLISCVHSSEATAVIAYFVGPEKHDVSFDQTGGDWKAEEDTAGWMAGNYRWEAWVALDGGVKRVCGSGAIVVAKSLGEETGGGNFDARTLAQRNVDSIEAMIEGNAGQGVRRYKINNRELERYSVDDLLKLLAYWKRRVRNEKGLTGQNIRYRL